MGRKRQMASSSDEEDSSNTHMKRRRYDDVEDRLEMLIYKLAERNTASIETDIERLAQVLLADLHRHKPRILKLLLFCVKKVPDKLTVYSTLIGLLNARNFDFGNDFVTSLSNDLKESLKIGNFMEAHRITRFMCDLVNSKVVYPQSVISLLESFIRTANEEGPQARSDFYVYAVLSSLPWCGRELSEKKSAELSRLVYSIEKYVAGGRRQKIHVPILQVWSALDPHPQEDYLDCLWQQIRHLDQDEWSESQILRPYLSFDPVLCEATQHHIPTVPIPPHTDGVLYPLPRVVFRMFDYTDVPDEYILPGAHSIERYLVEEQLSLIIHTYHAERKDCATQLLNYRVKNKIPLYYIIVEVIFSHLFNLPLPPYLELFYGALLIELCKLEPSALPQVLAQATELIFDRLPTMKALCVERYINWFSYNLSNFQLRWSWDYWLHVLENDPDDSPKLRFIREVIHKLIRFSYHKLVVKTLPEPYKKLIPPKNVCHYKYEENSDLPEAEVAKKLMNSMQQKATCSELQLILRELPSENSDDGVNNVKIDVFVSTLLYLGSKTFSHSYAALAKYHSLLKALAIDENSQIAMLRSVYNIWYDHPQMMVFLIDKMLRTQVIEPNAIANWLFGSEMADALNHCFTWEILHNTLRYVCTEAKKCRIAYEDALNACETSVSSSVTDEDLNVKKEKANMSRERMKNIFLIVFQRFIMVLTEFVSKCEKESVDHNTTWFHWMTERLQGIFLTFHSDVRLFISTLESLIFTLDIEFCILEIFQQFCALYA